MLYATLQEFLDAIAALAVDLSDEQRAEQIAALATEHIAPENLGPWLAESAESASALAGGDVTDDDLVTLTVLRDANVALAARSDAIAVAETERREAAAAMAAEIRGSDATPDGGETVDGEGEGEAPPAEGEQPAEAPPAEAPPAEGEGTQAEGADAVAVAASARQRAIRAAAARPGAVRLPGQRVPGQTGVLPDDIGEWGLVASANSARPGAVIRSREDLSQVFLEAIQTSRAMAPGTPPVNAKIFTLGGDAVPLTALGYDPDRILGRDAQTNYALIEAACGQRAIAARGGFEAITASGGICAPQQVNYDQMTLGSSGRPIRDSATVRFGADRGGIRMFPPVIMEEVEGAVSLWTAANDADPGSDGPETKACLTLTCPDDADALVDAIVQCLRIGNFRSRYFGEQVEAWLRLTAVWQARFAERRLFQQILDDSDAVDYSAQTLGTLPEVLAGLELACAGMRSSRRLDMDVPLRWVVPFWLIDQMAVDQARSMPAGTFDERFAISDADIGRVLTVRRVTPTWAMDAPEDNLGQEFGRQGDGPLIGWPSTAQTALYPDGYHLFLDGGQIDFGIVRDSVLNSTNDFVMMSESMEGHFFHGDISYDLTFDTCPSGARAALADNSGVCATGS